MQARILIYETSVGWYASVVTGIGQWQTAEPCTTAGEARRSLKTAIRKDWSAWRHITRARPSTAWQYARKLAEVYGRL